MRKRVSVLLGSVLVAALTAGSAPAQDILYTLVSPNSQYDGQFGISVSGAGDVDNDGYDDVIVGANHEDPGASPYRAGRAYVFSGATGDTLYSLVSPNEHSVGNFGISVSGAGDVNDDGYADVVVGAAYEDPGSSPEDAGRAYVFSGATGDTLYTLVSPNEEYLGYFGYSVSGAGDVNDDGYPDVIVGASRLNPWQVGPEGEGRAYVFSGPTGDLLRTLVSPNDTTGGFGNSVSGVGDVDDDSHADVIVGGWYEDADSVDAGRAYIFSGQAGDLLYTLVSPNQETGGLFGIIVSGAADVDNDGYPDVAVGSLDDPGTSPKNAGRAYVFSGATGSLLHTLASPHEQLEGWFGVVSGAGDVDNDDYADVIVGALGEGPAPSLQNAGRAYVFSGQTGDTLCTLVSPNEQAEGEFGIWVSGAGYVNNDDYADVIVGSLEDPGTGADAGRAYVFGWRMILSCDLSDGELALNWTAWPGASAYWVYGADNSAYFVPGLVDPWDHRLAVVWPGTAWSSSNGVGDPDHNWTYQIIAVDATEQEMCRSNRVGEFDFSVSATR